MTLGALSTATSRWKLSIAAVVSLLALACGDDSGDEGNGGNNNQPPPTGVVLSKGIVGKECTKNDDCGAGGRCSTTQSLGTLGDLLSSLNLGTNLVAPGGYCTIACANDANCGEGGVCFGALGALFMGECRKSCGSNDDCRSGYECAKSQVTGTDGGAPTGLGAGLANLPAQCQALPPADNLGANQAGAACSDAADAGVALNGACGDGYCTLNGCSGTCVNDTTCGAGGACVPNGVYGTSGTCQETCAQDSDCNQFAAGSIGCNDVNGRKLCGAKLFPLPPNVLGTPCTENTQCGNGQCAESLGGFPAVRAPDGYCTLNGCVDDTVCTGGACIGTGGFARCYDGCTVDSECRPGYACVERTSSSMVATKVCAPMPAARDAGTAPAPVVGLDGGI